MFHRCVLTTYGLSSGTLCMMSTPAPICLPVMLACAAQHTHSHTSITTCWDRRCCCMQGSALENASQGLFAPGACTEMADEAEKAGVTAHPSDPEPEPKELNLRELAASEQMAQASEKHGIIWARVKGFPHWPVCAHPSRGSLHPLCLPVSVQH